MFDMLFYHFTSHFFILASNDYNIVLDFLYNTITAGQLSSYDLYLVTFSDLYGRDNILTLFLVLEFFNDIVVFGEGLEFDRKHCTLGLSDLVIAEIQDD